MRQVRFMIFAPDGAGFLSSRRKPRDGLRGATLVLGGFQHGHVCSFATKVPHDGGTLVPFAFQHSHAFLHFRVRIETLIEFARNAFELDGQVGDLGLHRRGTRFVLTSGLQRFFGRLQLLGQSLHQRSLLADSRLKLLLRSS